MTTTLMMRWDLLLFTATTTVVVAHYYYNYNYNNNNSNIARNPKRPIPSFIGSKNIINNNDINIDSKKKSQSSVQKRVSFRLDAEPKESSSLSYNSNSNSNNNDCTVHPSIVGLLPSIDFTTTASSSTTTSHNSSNNIQMIGLLFAAKWCPDCTDVVAQIGKVYDDYLKQLEMNSDQEQEHWLQIIYISSDVDETSIQQFKPTNMLHVPYHAFEERNRVKQLYQTCAMKEMTSLQITKRKHGIPTLLLLNAKTGAILKENAVDDVLLSFKNVNDDNNSHQQQQLLDKWKQLLLLEL